MCHRCHVCANFGKVFLACATLCFFVDLPRVVSHVPHDMAPGTQPSDHCWLCADCRVRAASWALIVRVSRDLVSATLRATSGRNLVMVMVIYSALVRSHQSTYKGSFGPVLPPGWLCYTRSVVVPLDVEGLTRPPLATQCPLRRPGVGVVLLSHCWLWGMEGWGRGACTAPVLSILGLVGASPRPDPRVPRPVPHSCARSLLAIRSLVPSV